MERIPEGRIVLYGGDSDYWEQIGPSRDAINFGLRLIDVTYRLDKGFVAQNPIITLSNSFSAGEDGERWRTAMLEATLVRQDHYMRAVILVAEKDGELKAEHLVK